MLARHQLMQEFLEGKHIGWDPVGVIRQYEDLFESADPGNNQVGMRVVDQVVNEIGNIQVAGISG